MADEDMERSGEDPEDEPGQGDAQPAASPGAEPARPPLPELDPEEARVLGVLIEKGYTTPEQYPLTLNAMTSGANQKSNRNPMFDVDEVTVREAVTRLREKGLASAVHLASGRVERFRHTAREGLGLDGGALAVLAELMLRGPQTPGELRGRASRMVPIHDLPALGDILEPLQRAGFVKRLAPAPGSRAMRYAQLVSPDSHPLGPEDDAAFAATPSPGPRAASRAPEAAGRDSRAAELEARVEALEAEVEALKAEAESRATEVDGLRSDFEALREQFLG